MERRFVVFEKMKRILLLIGLIVMLIVISGCNNGITQEENVEREDVKWDGCPIKEYLPTWYTEQEITVRLLDSRKDRFEYEKGVCLNIDYYWDRETKLSNVYNDYALYPYPYKIENSKSGLMFKLQRFTPHDYIVISVGDIEERFDLHNCNQFRKIQMIINFSTEKKYICIFDGEIKSTNNSYKDLQGQICDKYKIQCEG